MGKFKKLFLVILLIALVAFISTPVFAQKRIFTSRPLETTGIFVDRDGDAMDYEVWIYGITIFADDASSFVGLYDCDTFLELTDGSTYARDEIGEATQFENKTKWYAEPEKYSDGVGGIITVGTAFVHYGPTPTN